MPWCILRMSRDKQVNIIRHDLQRQNREAVGSCYKHLMPVLGRPNDAIADVEYAGSRCWPLALFHSIYNSMLSLFVDLF